MPRSRQKPKPLFYSWDEVPIVFDVPMAARLFGFTADAMSRKCAKGEFPAHKVFGEWRIDKNEAIEFFKQQQIN